MNESFDRPERDVRSLALGLFVVEYSLAENSPSVRTLENVLRDNIGNVRKGLAKDYLPVGLFNSREDASRFVEKFTLLLAEEESQIEFRWQRVADVLEKLLEQMVSDPEFESQKKK